MASTTRSVRVARSGNSRMLPVPAELARAAGAAIGDSYIVEVAGGDIIYHRDRGLAMVSGTGPARVGIVSAGRAMPVTGRSRVPALDSWDF